MYQIHTLNFFAFFVCKKNYIDFYTAFSIILMQLTATKSRIAWYVLIYLQG